MFFSLLAGILLAGAFLLPSAALAQSKDDEAEEGERYDPFLRENEVIQDSPFEQLEVACVEQLDGKACFDAAVGWQRGDRGAKANPRQAFHLYKAGCGFEYAPACTAGATMILRAQAGFLILRPKGTLSLDFGEAARLLGLACTMGDVASCGLYGDLVLDPEGMLPNDGTVHRELRSDPLAARQAYMDACPLPEETRDTQVERDPRSCIRLAQLFRDGRAGLRRDTAESRRYYELACRTGKSEDACVQADLLAAEAIEGVEERPRAARQKARRKSLQPQRPTPDLSRFHSSRDALVDATGRESHHRRFDLTLGLGARWTYGDPPIAGMSMRLGGVAWFNMLGIAFDGTFLTDKFARPYEREYLKLHHGVGPQLAVPIRHNLPYPISIRMVVGVGGTIGVVQRGFGAPFLLGYGAREHIQIEVGTAALSGPRQWGAIRFEQEQTWYSDTGDNVEHASQVLLLGGFSFGGLDVDWTPKRKD